MIGASAEPTKLGHAVLLNLLRGNFAGPVYPVNPDAVSVQGVRAYAIGHRHSRTRSTWPLSRCRPPTVAEVVESCRVKGVHGLVVMTAGFADGRRRRTDGAEAQRHMVSVAQGRRDAGARTELPRPGQHRSGASG